MEGRLFRKGVGLDQCKRNVYVRRRGTIPYRTALAVLCDVSSTGGQEIVPPEHPVLSLACGGCRVNLGFGVVSYISW